jgi:hypothetical protein
MLAAAGLAEALRGMGRYPEARALDEASFAWRRNALGSDHPETLIAAHDLAVDLRKLSEVEASRDPLRDTLTRRRSVLGEDDPETLATACNLGVTLRDLGDLGEARSLHEDADLYDLGNSTPYGNWTRTHSPESATSWARIIPTPAGPRTTS